MSTVLTWLLRGKRWAHSVRSMCGGDHKHRLGTGGVSLLPSGTILGAAWRKRVHRLLCKHFFCAERRDDVRGLSNGGQLDAWLLELLRMRSWHVLLERSVRMHRLCSRHVLGKHGGYSLHALLERHL